MKPLEDSIRENGIIQPLMVRKDDKADVYEIISGHRRYLAATRLKLTEVPVVVLDITKEEADIILVDSNLYREHILPSEKAFAYKMKMDAIKRQGSFISGGVVVTLAVKLVYTHWIYLVSLSCKNRSCTHRHEAEAPLPRAGFDPFGRKLRQGTFVDLPL